MGNKPLSVYFKEKEKQVTEGSCCKGQFGLKSTALVPENFMEEIWGRLCFPTGFSGIIFNSALPFSMLHWLCLCFFFWHPNHVTMLLIYPIYLFYKHLLSIFSRKSGLGIRHIVVNKNDLCPVQVNRQTCEIEIQCDKWAISGWINVCTYRGDSD